MGTIAKLLKGVFFILLTIILLACALYFYARYIEPRWVELIHLTVSDERVPVPLRVVAFADTHIGNQMDASRLQEMMDQVAAQNPDIVVFLGDLFDNYAGYHTGDEDQLAHILSLPALPHAEKYAVYGNHDLGGKARGAFEAIMDRAGYQVLVNQAVASHGITVIGADDLIFGAPDIDGLAQTGVFSLLLVHEPDFADLIQDIDLQLSGHTHGGQVRIPFTGPLVLPQWGRRYIRGMHEKPDGGQVYVTRGLGMSKLPFRFAARPEITVIDVVPS